MAANQRKRRRGRGPEEEEAASPSDARAAIAGEPEALGDAGDAAAQEDDIL